MDRFALKENLYLDPRTGVITFQRSARNVLVCKAGVAVSLPDLLAVIGRCVPVDQERKERHFAPEVASELTGLGVMGRPQAAIPAQPPAGEIPLAPPESGPSGIEPVPAAAPTTPAAKVKKALSTLKEGILQQLGRAGVQAVAGGKFDETVRSVVSDLRRQLRPSSILRQVGSAPPLSRHNTADRVANATVATQAFGRELELGEEELFVLAKCALLYGLKEQDRENLPVIKRNLLSEKPSLSFLRRLVQSYGPVLAWLRQLRVGSEIVSTIERSQFIYHRTPAPRLAPAMLVLAVTDAFLALKEGGEKFLIIDQIISDRLRLTAREDPAALDAIPKLIAESCYGEYRASSRTELGGGDHCALLRIDRSRVGLLIFDVSGRDEEASRIRERLVGKIETIRERTQPSAFISTINDFLLGGDFPEDRFVSLLYGIVDLENDTFRYTNAGHNPPYLIRHSEILPMEKNDLLLAGAARSSTTHELPICREDCLVFYAGGSTEARKPRQDEILGGDRPEKALAAPTAAGKAANCPASTILRIVADEGFTIEDDVTVQVYRHL